MAAFSPNVSNSGPFHKPHQNRCPPYANTFHNTVPYTNINLTPTYPRQFTFDEIVLSS